MIAIRVIFDGKSFVPQQPVVLPDQSEALVIVDQADPAAQARLDDDIRAYYQSIPDSDNDAWGKAAAPNDKGGYSSDTFIPAGTQISYCSHVARPGPTSSVDAGAD